MRAAPQTQNRENNPMQSRMGPLAAPVLLVSGIPDGDSEPVEITIEPEKS
jgi:hypothetical protein